MAYTIRNTLMDKMEVAFTAAAKKEGREVREEPLGDTMLESRDIAYHGNGNFLLVDGRYVTEFWDGENDRNFLMVIDNLPVDVLRFLVQNDHYIATQERWRDDHEDFEYQNYLRFEDSEEPKLVNPLDRHPHWDAYFADGKADETENADSFDYSFDPDRPGVPFQPPVIRYTPSGRFSDKTKKDLKTILHIYLRRLPPEKIEWFNILFTGGVPQKDLAEMDGVSEAAISKRKKWYEDKIADFFRSLGYPALSKTERTKEKKKEQKERAAYEKHYEEVSKALRELYCPENGETEGEIEGEAKTA